MTVADQPEGHDGHPRCGALKRDGSGDHCGQAAGWGTSHPGIGTCKLHGGATANHEARASLELATRAVTTYGLPRDVDPHTALLEELHRTAGHVAWLGAVVAALEQDDLWARVGGGQGAIPGAEPHVWVRMYQTERALLTKVAKTCHDVGIEERRVKLIEDAGREFASFARGLAAGLGVQDHPQLWDVFRTEIAKMTVLQLGTADTA